MSTKKIYRVLFMLIRSAICGRQLSLQEKALYCGEMLPELQKISASHDIAHLVALGMKQNGLMPKEGAEIEKAIFLAVYRYEQIKTEYKKLCDFAEEARLLFVPLKGAVIRKYYPEAWMRTSCDIDVLLKEEDCEEFKNILVDKKEYIYHKKGMHDISIFSPSNLHIELHYTLVEDGVANESSNVLKNVWDDVKVGESYEYLCEMSDEMFYFYHIAHMAKHFENGGCGIRPVIDLWILDNQKGADRQKRDKLLEEGKLLKFANVVRRLSRVWFEDEKSDLLSEQLEEYILTGGIFGNSKNRITLQQQKKGGKVGYAISKIFIPYEVIKFHYPILQKHKWLTPVMEVRRWVKLIFCGHLKRTTKELELNSNISKNDAEDMQEFLKNIGL